MFTEAETYMEQQLWNQQQESVEFGGVQLLWNEVTIAFCSP